MKKTSVILEAWSAEAYPTEKPLFFAKALLQLLSDGKIKLAGELLMHSNKLIKDNTEG
jgi:hypothetical protein